MESLTFGKRTYALGLRWVEGDPTRKPPAQVKEALGGGKALYCLQESSDGRVAIGFCDATKLPKTARYSFADAVAATGKDGIYALPVGRGGMLWYVVVAEGQVVPETDAVVPFEDGCSAIENLRAALSLPVYYSGAEALPMDATESFDPQGIATAARIKPLRTVGGSQAGGALVLVLVLGGIGVGGWMVLHKGKPSAAEVAAQQAQAVRDAYLSALHQQVDVLPADAGWVVDAWQASERAFPPAVGGWHRDGFACQPTGCAATYAAASAWAMAPIDAVFGRSALLSADQKTLVVNLPLTTKTQAWTDAQLLAPIRWPRTPADTVGRLAMQSLVTLEGAPTLTNLTEGQTAPPEAQSVLKDTITVKDASYVGATQLAGLTHFFAADGYAPVTLSVVDGPSAAYRVEFQRIGGR